MNDNNNNVEQENYYNNDSYYSNNDYNSNYSDSSYEEKDKNSGVWWKILLIILILLIIILLLLKFCGRSKKSSDVRYEELRVRICNAAETYAGNNPSIITTQDIGKSVIIKYQTLADANLIESRIANPYYDGGLFKKATQEKYYSMNNSVRLLVQSDGTYYCELVDNASDITAPELRLNGDEEITLAVGTEFDDPGYTATDDYDGDITDKVVRSGNVDYSKAGTYVITYSVSDSAGNTTSKKRTIIYEEFADLDITLGSILDGVTPMIQLKGSNPYCLVKGTQYVEPGATATDNVDGNITDRITVTNKVTGNIMGAFRIVYKVEDSSGNQAIAYRAVIVTTSCPNENSNNDSDTKVVNNAPVITLVGKSSVTINKGTEYIDLGATAYDKEDGDITYRLVTDTSNVNTNRAGVYKVIYRVTDSHGKTSTKTRTVTVKDNTAGNPSVRFTESKENITVYAGKGNDSLLTAPKAVNENGVQVLVTRTIEDYVTKAKVNSIDWSKSGKYRVIYTAIHGNGSLTQTKTIVVTILDPTVEIGGKNPIEVPLRTTNCNITEADLIIGGVTFKTTGAATPIVSLKDNEDKACKVGTYKIEVTATIENGEPATKIITVNVVDKEAEERDKTAPGKTIITSNTANPTNVYNTNGVWAGGATTGITIGFMATPATGTTIAHFEYSIDCKTAIAQTSLLPPNMGTLTWELEGKTTVCIRAVNTDGIAGPWSDPIKLYLDLTAPTVQFTHKWKDGKEDWHNDPTLTLSYVANEKFTSLDENGDYVYGSGLDHFEYTYDDVKAKKADEITTYSESTGKLTVNENTEPTRPSLFVYVRAVDKVGNVGEWTKNPAYANIDTVKPNTPTFTVSGNNTPTVKLTGTFTDGESVRPSGFGKYIYTLNNGSELTETSNVITMPGHTGDADLNYDVRVWAVDKAGNKSDGYANLTVIEKPNVPVTGVTIKNGTKDVSGATCNTSALYPSKTITLTATITPSNATNKTVSWSSSDESIATIDKDGKVKAIKVGEATITVTVGGKSNTCTLKVTTQPSSGGSTPTNYTPGGSGGSGGSGGGSSWQVKDSKGNVTYFATEEAAVAYVKNNPSVGIGGATINSGGTTYANVNTGGSAQGYSMKIDYTSADKKSGLVENQAAGASGSLYSESSSTYNKNTGTYNNAKTSTTSTKITGSNYVYTTTTTTKTASGPVTSTTQRVVALTK